MTYRKIEIEGLPSQLYATFVIMDAELYSMIFYWKEEEQQFRVIYERYPEVLCIDREEALNMIHHYIENENWRWIKR